MHIKCFLKTSEAIGLLFNVVSVLPACGHHGQDVPEEARRGHQTGWNWRYRQM